MRVKRGWILAAVAVLAGAPPLAAQSGVGPLLAAGDSARCRRDAEAALAHYRSALALDSLDYDANWRAAQALVDIGKQLPDAERQRRDALYAEARALAERAVRVNSPGADGHFMVAVAVGRVALTRSARERVRYARVVRDEALRATELDPLHDGALHVLARWNAEIQRLPGVTKFFARTFLGAAIFAEATWENAVSYFERAINIAPANIYHHLVFAEALVDMDRPEDAVAHLRQAASLPLGCDPQDADYQRQARVLLERLTRR
jgi:tetratricopeptide (TPR) repeat protein